MKSKRMKFFLSELARLMEEHKVTEMEATESQGSWMGTMAEGVEFTMQYEEDGLPIMEIYEVGRWATPETIRKESKED